MNEHSPINDVRRKINEVMKKTSEQIVVGWRPSLEEKRQEGDVWEDVGGKKWTIKNGVRQTVTKLDAAKTPHWCPQCSKPLNHRIDVKFWRIRNKCMDCIIKEETEIRRQGKWKEYEESIMKANYIAALEDKIQELQHLYENVSTPEVIHADDYNILMVEKWNVNVDQIKKDLLEDIEKLKENLKQVQEMSNDGQSQDTN